MIQRLLIAAGIGLTLAGGAYAEGAKTGAKASAATSDSTAAAIAHCDKLSGTQKATCLQQARETVDRSATGATSSSASGRAGAAASPSQPKDAAPASGASRSY